MENRSRLGSAHDQDAEALVVELIERLELLELRANLAGELEREVDRLRLEREVLDAELDHATGVVAELTRQLIHAEAKLAEQPASLAAHVRRLRR